MSHAIQARFHEQIRQHGQELLSFVADELRRDPPGISITLSPLKFPGAQANRVWCVGSADTATEHAVLRFFQTDAGRRALVSADGQDVVEFKLASTLLLLPAHASREQDPVLPAELTPAATAQPSDQQVVNLMVRSGPPPAHPVRVHARTSGWLQIPHHTSFTQVMWFDLEQQSRKQQAHTGMRSQAHVY